MTARSTMARERRSVQYDGPGIVRDRHQNAAMHHLACVGFSTTPGGANARAQRVRRDLLAIISAFQVVDAIDALDRFFAPLDLARIGGPIQLTDAAYTSIERSDAEDGVWRSRYRGEPTLANAREAENAALKAVRAHLEFVRGLHTAHPELGT